MVEVKELRRRGDPFLLPLIMVMTQVRWICTCTSRTFKVQPRASTRRYRLIQGGKKLANNILILVLRLPFVFFLFNLASSDHLPSIGCGTRLYTIYPPKEPPPLLSGGCAGYVTHLCARGHRQNRINNVWTDFVVSNHTRRSSRACASAEFRII